MNWLRMHPYTIAITVACALIACGIWLVQDRLTTVPDLGTSSWNATQANSLQPDLTPQTLPSTETQPVGTAASSTAILPYTQDNQTKAQQDIKGSPSDYDTFIFELSSSIYSEQAKPNNQPSTENPFDAYSFVPSGMLSTTSVSVGYSASQQALYDYGNTAGRIIESYEQHSASQVGVIKDSLEDRENQAKASAVEQIGNDLIAAGQGLTKITPITAQITSQNAALAKNYQIVGQNLIKVAQASTQRDSDFIKAIETYNASADVFVKSYAALALTISASGVRFAPTDSGSVFSFTPGTGF